MRTMECNIPQMVNHKEAYAENTFFRVIWKGQDHLKLKIRATNQQQRRRQKSSIHHERPPYTYELLVTMAFKNIQTNAMFIASILKWISDQYPYFKTLKSYSTCVRNSLSHSKSFRKCYVCGRWVHLESTSFQGHECTDSDDSGSARDDASFSEGQHRNGRKRKRPDFFTVKWNRTQRVKPNKMLLFKTRGVERSKRRKGSAPSRSRHRLRGERRAAQPPGGRKRDRVANKNLLTNLLELCSVDAKLNFLANLGLFSNSLLEGTMLGPTNAQNASNSVLADRKRPLVATDDDNGASSEWEGTPTPKKSSVCGSDHSFCGPPPLDAFSSDSESEASDVERTPDVTTDCNYSPPVRARCQRRKQSLNSGLRRSNASATTYITSGVFWPLSRAGASVDARCQKPGRVQPRHAHLSGSPVLPAIESVFSIKKGCANSYERTDVDSHHAATDDVIDLCSDSEDEESGELSQTSTMQNDGGFHLNGPLGSPRSGTCQSPGTMPTWTRNIWEPVMTATIKPPCRVSRMFFREAREPQHKLLLLRGNQRALVAPYAVI